MLMEIWNLRTKTYASEEIKNDLIHDEIHVQIWTDVKLHKHQMLRTSIIGLCGEYNINREY